MKTPREKYQNDPTYRAIVDVMCAHIHAAKFTPSEMREAVLLACILYEEQKVRIIMHPCFPEGVEHALNVLYEWAEVKTDERRKEPQ